MFPEKLTPTIKLKVASGLAWNTFSSPKLRENILAETPPTAHMVVAANKHTVLTHYASLITRSSNPQEKSTSHPDAIVGNNNEILIWLHDWVSCVSPKTQEGFEDIIQLPTMLVSDTTCIDKSSEQTWTLVRHILFLPL